MSKEFVPGVGLTSSSSANIGENLMSPSMKQFIHRDPKNIPYWSPATKISSTGADRDMDIHVQKSNSNLVASAREFVPTFGSSSSSSGAGPSSSSTSNPSFLSSEATGMNSSASEWRPPQLQQHHEVMMDPPPSELPQYHTAEGSAPDPLVEVGRQ